MNEPPRTRLRYCPHHHRVYSIRTRRWHMVPEDFIAELQQANLPVDVVAQRCPKCTTPPRYRPQVP